MSCQSDSNRIVCDELLEHVNPTRATSSACCVAQSFKDTNPARRRRRRKNASKTTTVDTDDELASVSHKRTKNCTTYNTSVNQDLLDSRNIVKVAAIKIKPQVATALTIASVVVQFNHQNKTKSTATNNNNNNNNNNKTIAEQVVITNEAILCAGCHAPIRERFLLKALDKHWHEDCLKCVCCDCRLGELGSTLFFRAEQILCRRDFLRIFCPSGNCSACKKIIQPYEFVMRARQHAYHLDCFKCHQCKYRFCVGDKFRLISAATSPSKQNTTTSDEYVLCTECHLATDSSISDLDNCSATLETRRQLNDAPQSVASSSRSSTSSLLSLSPPPSAPQKPQPIHIQSLLSASLTSSVTKKASQKQIQLAS